MVQLVLEDAWWEPVHADSFLDGGSVALGLVNNGGQVFYLWAQEVVTPDIKPDKQQLYLMLHYDDPHPVPVVEHSELEERLLEIFDEMEPRPHQEVFLPMVQAFRDLLADRRMHVKMDVLKPAGENE